MQNRLKPGLFLAAIMFFSPATAPADMLLAADVLLGGTDQTVPSPQQGALVFQQRCILCHGNKGMGDGALPVLLKGYPSTNLFDSKYGSTEKDIREVVISGGKGDKKSPYSPPWGDELTWVEIESVVQFLMLLRNSNEQATRLLKLKSNLTAPSKKIGQMVFRTRCVLCHGIYGEGNGKMARIINSPPPFNLTKSTASDVYLEMIISRGGEAVGRSLNMPPWNDELTKTELQSVISYIKTLRE
jgi:cbb3-type cytochrome c oxidase subunit III